MQLTLKDLQFRIAEATISGAISDPYWCDTYNGGRERELHWFVDVRGEKQEVDDEIWEPSVYHESLVFPIRHWVELAGQVFAWNAPFDEVTGEPNGGFYVFDHEDIAQATLRFLQRDGFNFGLHWEGVCNVGWNDEYGENVPFSLDAVAVFKGIRVSGNESDNDETMRERLAIYLDPADFIQHPIKRLENKYESGVGMAQSFFEPRF